MKTAKTIGIVALAAGAAALLYRPTQKLVSKMADKRRAARQAGDTDHSGHFAGHYLGIKRHHSRKADNRKPAATA